VFYRFGGMRCATDSLSRVVRSFVFLLSGCRSWVCSRVVVSVRGVLVVCPAGGLPRKWRTS